MRNEVGTQAAGGPSDQHALARVGASARLIRWSWSGEVSGVLFDQGVNYPSANREVSCMVQREVWDYGYPVIAWATGKRNDYTLNGGLGEISFCSVDVAIPIRLHRLSPYGGWGKSMPSTVIKKPPSFNEPEY